MTDRLILMGGNVIPMTAEGVRAQTLALEGRRIRLVGSREDVHGLMDQGWPVLDLTGKTVLPGFIDTHQHMMLTGSQATAVHLDDVGSLADILDRISTRCRETEPDEWVRGSYLNEQNIAEKRMPTRQELDRVSAERPLFVMHATCHMCSLNSKALELLDPPRDLNGLDLQGGQPTGVVRDPGILTFVHPAMARMTTENRKLAYLQEAARMALAKGITTLHALDGGDLGPGETRIIWAHRQELPVGVVCYNQCMDLREVAEMGLPRVGGCICADGAFEAHTAALFEPYADEPDNYGELTYSQETMDRFIRDANRAGLQVSVHCESERSIEQVLWAMEKALRDFPRTDHRHRIEHLELPTHNQIARMARAGVVAAMQPAFIPAFIGHTAMETYERLLGKARLSRVHPYRTILDHGIQICGGSDSPVTSYDPLAGIQAAVNHPNPEQRVTRFEAVRMFTATAAWSAFEEADKGTIEPGKRADLVILDRDPFQVAADHIASIRAEMVFVGGRRYLCGSQ